MARENEKKKRWSLYISRKLDEQRMSAADLARAADLTDATVSNWRVGRAGISSEIALVVAAVLNLDAAEVLENAGFPILARAMQGKELHIASAPAKEKIISAPPKEKIDPAIRKIMSRDDLTDEVKAVMIEWWNKRKAEDDRRRREDAEGMIALYRAETVQPA